MYYYDKYIGDMPNIMLRGNLNYTNAKFIANLLNKVAKEILGVDININIEKIVGTYKFEYAIPYSKYDNIYAGANVNVRKQIITYAENTYLISSNITEITDLRNWFTNKGHKINSVYMQDVEIAHKYLSHIWEKVRRELKNIFENMKLDSSNTWDIKKSNYYKKVEIYYNQLDFIGDWIGKGIGYSRDYGGEISYDDGTIWVHPSSVGYEKWLKSYR
mgnify:CR=1 FL=1